ncbi:MAG: LysM peptidoglycan-binding domain-containing protein [Victivallaceae bacterium]|nr:LysM peptidoglycan-binding domain-containing protein [Victivallaceae bacterium]
MKEYTFIFVFASMLLLMTGCETLNPGGSQSQYVSNPDIIELKNEVALLKREIHNIRNSNTGIAQNLASLQNQINYVNEQNQQQAKALDSLSQEISQEKTQRRQALDKVVETVADQTAKTVNSIAAQSVPKPSPASGPAAGAYYKHKVAAGETLSAIARAYKVSVTEIKEANNIKGHIIRVGQILHIPKK